VDIWAGLDCAAFTSENWQVLGCCQELKRAVGKIDLIDLITKQIPMTKIPKLEIREIRN